VVSDIRRRHFFVYRYFSEEYTALVSLAMGLLASLLFFSSVVAHELPTAWWPSETASQCGA